MIFETHSKRLTKYGSHKELNDKKGDLAHLIVVVHFILIRSILRKGYCLRLSIYLY